MQIFARVILTLWICLGMWHGAILAQPTTKADGDDVSSKIKALIARRCLSCHSGDDPKGHLVLTSRETLLSGGASGPAIVANHPEKSLLWDQIDQNVMPPKHPISSDEKRLIKDWITAGAVWSGGPIDPRETSSDTRAGLDWWSLQPLKPVRVPRNGSSETSRQPIDDFVAARLASKKLTMSPAATPRTLIRRVTFDLLGLPPSPDEIDRFVADDRPDAWERLIDRLLASPHYGERWARHWLDVVRFGESNGFERDLPRENAWHYRDWVIAALNRDMPYDDFARWQLAGDLIATEDVEALKAVGFLVAGAHDTVVPVVDRMRATMRQDELEDIVGTVGQTFLGLTVNCARCHDHKFDPISSQEYYQLASALAGIDHGEREFAPEPVAKQLLEWRQKIDELVKSLHQGVALSGDPAKSKITEAEILQALTPDQREKRRVKQAELDELKKRHADLQKNGVVRIYSAVATQPGPMRIHNRGSVMALGDEVEPAGLAAVQGLPAAFGLRPDAIESHRRRHLADWITDHRNSLFTRVMTNRIWHYHFGAGLVETPNDLGFHAGLPSHPDLFEWLSSEFRGDRVDLASSSALPSSPHLFSLKRLHRLVLTSATYRQSSAFNAHAAEIDVNNRLLWRISPRRLEAEEVRDTMLVVAGELNPQLGGKGYSDVNSYFFKGTQFYDPIDPVGAINHRRTIYRMWARGGRSPFLDNFDCPDPSTTTPRRSSTVTPLQALSLLNHSFGLRMASHLADRLTAETSASTVSQVQHAYRLLLGREVEADELALSQDFISRRGLPAFCRAMWNASEFLYLE